MVRTSASQFHQCVAYVKLETVVIILKLRTLNPSIFYTEDLDWSIILSVFILLEYDFHMPRKCKYRCNGCGHENTYEVPDFEGDYTNYGNKLPCGQCGQIAGMMFMEDLGYN